MTDAGGGFYSAEDADSVITPAHPDLKGEGAFYIWSIEEIRALLSQPAADWFCYRYGVREGGNVDSDPHGEFTGRNILYQAHTVEETARHFGRPAGEVQAALDRAAGILLAARAQRVRPHLDDKILTAWNGLMISAFAKGGAVLDEPATPRPRGAPPISSSATVRCRRPAPCCAAIARAMPPSRASSTTTRCSSRGCSISTKRSSIGAIWNSPCGSPKSSWSCSRTPNAGAFFSTAADDRRLVLRVKEDYDGAEPSGNSVAVMNLLRLAQMTNRAAFRESAERTLAAFASRLQLAPVAIPQMLAACEFLLGEPREIILAGAPRQRGDAGAAARVASPLRPQPRGAAGGFRRGAAGAGRRHSLHRVHAARRTAVPARTFAANYTCQLPVSEPAKFAELIQY